MTVLRAILTTVHAGTAAIWLGAMLYSLLIVQPRASSLLGKGYERLAAQLAAGARWKVIAMIGVLAASGFGLVALDAGGKPTSWVGLMVAKTILLIAALALFAHVSWRLWPQRIFALPMELLGVQSSFRRTALLLTALVATAFALGTIADAIAAS
jgi:hypothetical protein